MNTRMITFMLMEDAETLIHFVRHTQFDPKKLLWSGEEKDVCRFYIRLHHPSAKNTNCKFFKSIYIKFGLTYAAPQGMQLSGAETVWYAEKDEKAAVSITPRC
jgi:hypothetical protein